LRPRVASFPRIKISCLTGNKLGGTKATIFGEKNAMQQRSADPRIAKTFGNDRLWAFTALAVLWGTYLFVLYRVHSTAGYPEAVWTLAAAGSVVLLFNTAAILTMVAHFAEDRDQIYGLDLHYQDAAKRPNAA
jgi:hypothetical protein